MCEINCHGITTKQGKYDYKYVKTMMRGNLDVVKMIKDAPTAYNAKQTVKRLPYSSSWKTETNYERHTRAQMQTSTQIQGSFNQFHQCKLSLENAFGVQGFEY